VLSHHELLDSSGSEPRRSILAHVEVIRAGKVPAFPIR